MTLIIIVLVALAAACFLGGRIVNKVSEDFTAKLAAIGLSALGIILSLVVVIMAVWYAIMVLI